jgi:hypothetical protein
VKKTGIVLLILVAAVFGILVFRGVRGQSVEAQDAPVTATRESAQALWWKIQSVKQAPPLEAGREPRRVEVNETELESYVLYDLQQDIPARLESVDVQLTPGAVAADVKMTFPSDATGNVAIDTIISGTHTLFVKGRLLAENRNGRFYLEETRLDGIPVPTILIEGLLARFVKPRYPEVNISEPFVLPWNIRSIVISSGSASIEY